MKTEAFFPFALLANLACDSAVPVPPLAERVRASGGAPGIADSATTGGHASPDAHAGLDTGTAESGSTRWAGDAAGAVEQCNDGADDDGDGLRDCEDGDCGASCADPCATPLVLGDPSHVSGSTEYRSSRLRSSCVPSESSTGRDTVYAFTASQTGMLDVDLDSVNLLNVSIRTTCDEAHVELGCARDHLSVSIEAGQTVFIVVDGYEAADEGPYQLRAASRPIACGDGVRDDSEECDDDNPYDGDGCDSACRLELTEVEGNDAPPLANAHGDPFIARIAPKDDVDFVSVSLDAESSSLVAEVVDLGDDACARDAMDPALALVRPNAADVVTTDDDSGPGLCPRIVASGLSPGIYYVRVARSNGTASATFPYRLRVETDACGNGLLTDAEQCDDGNADDGDGCSASCRVE